MKVDFERFSCNNLLQDFKYMKNVVMICYYESFILYTLSFSYYFIKHELLFQQYFS